MFSRDPTEVLGFPSNHWTCFCTVSLFGFLAHPDICFLYLRSVSICLPQKSYVPAILDSSVQFLDISWLCFLYIGRFTIRQNSICSKVMETGKGRSKAFVLLCTFVVITRCFFYHGKDVHVNMCICFLIY